MILCSLIRIFILLIILMLCNCVSLLYILQAFGNLYLQFSKLNENMTENYSTTCTTLGHVNDICNSTSNDILNNYNKSIERNESLQHKIHSDIDILKNSVESDIGKVKFVFPSITLNTFKY